MLITPAKILVTVSIRFILPHHIMIHQVVIQTALRYSEIPKGFNIREAVSSVWIWVVRTSFGSGQQRVLSLSFFSKFPGDP